MKPIFVLLCVSCIPNYAQNLLTRPSFTAPPATITYYQLLHRPTRHVRQLLTEGAGKMRRRDYQGAISSLQSALALDRGSWEGHVNLGAAYFWCGNIESAQTEFESAIALDPNSPLSYADLAVCRLREGKGDSAVSLAKQALQLDPQNGLAKRILKTGTKLMTQSGAHAGQVSLDGVPH